MSLIGRIEAAKRLGISLPTLKKRTDSKEYNTIKQGKNLMYFEEEIENGRTAIIDRTTKTEQSALPVPTMKDLEKNKFSKDLTLIQEEKRNFMVLLNNEPPKGWLKQHPNAKKKDQAGKYIPLMYLPIERIEYLLSRIFVSWWVEVLFAPQILGNSIVVTIRLHYISPVTMEKEFQDGIGAAPIQTDAGAGATDATKVKSNGVMLAAPMAETYAIKDAADKLGKLFGKDLGRTEVIDYSSLIKKKTDKSVDELTAIELERLKELILSANTLEHLDNIEKDVLDSGVEELRTLLYNRSKTLENE